MFKSDLAGLREQREDISQEDEAEAGRRQHGGAKLKMKQKDKRCHGSLSVTVQKIFSEATTEAMGSTFQAIIISFQLKQKFGKDPYDVLIDNPKAFYKGLREISGDGADLVLSLVGALLSKRYGSNRSAEEFLALFTRSDSQSKHELKEIFRRIADQGREETAEVV